VNAAVRDQLLDRHFRDFTPNRIKARHDNRFRSVVNDQVASGGHFQRTDVSPLPANDAALHLVAGKIDDRHRRLHDMLSSATLNAHRNDLFCLFLSGLPRFFLDSTGNGNGFAAGVGLDLLQKLPFGLLGSHPRNHFQLPLLLVNQFTDLFLVQRE
jgi:hypothetical protein